MKITTKEKRNLIFNDIKQKLKEINELTVQIQTKVLDVTYMVDTLENTNFSTLSAEQLETLIKANECLDIISATPDSMFFSTVITESKLDIKISSLLIDLGITTNMKGFDYISFGIKISLQDRNLLKNISKSLLVEIANKFDEEPSRIERDIRTSIKKSYTSGKMSNANNLLGYPVFSNQKPTVKIFFTSIVNTLYLHLKGK